MKKLSSFDFILFDFDGVIVDSPSKEMNIKRKILEESGFTYSEEYMYEHFTGYGCNTIVQKVSEEQERNLPSGLADRMRQAINASRHTLPLISDIKKVLENISVPFCIASNNTIERVNLLLEIHALNRLIDPELVFSADIVAYGKPSPDLFLHIAEKLGYESGKCVVIEDSNIGIEAAKKAGMQAIGFTGGEHHTDKSGAGLQARGADHISPDARALSATLEEHANG